MYLTLAFLKIGLIFHISHTHKHANSPVLNIGWRQRVLAWRTHLNETNGSRLFTETLTTQVEAVFANKTSLMGTEAAGSCC